MRIREMRRLEYQKYIIDKPDCRQMWGKWSSLIMDVGTKINSNLEYVEGLNNSSYGVSVNDSYFDFWIYSHNLSDILPPERIKFDLLNEIDSTLKLLNFNREKENYLERFQYEIIAIFMTYIPFLSTSSYYGKDIVKTSAGYKAEWLRCSTTENRLKFNLHEFYQYLLKFMYEISLVEEYIIEKLNGLVDVQIVPDNFYPFSDIVEVEEVLSEEVTLDMIYRELKCASYQLVMMYVIGDFVPFYKENFNQQKLKRWTKLVYEKIGVTITYDGFRPALSVFTSEWDKPIKSKRYNAVVTGDAKKAVLNIIKKYPVFFKNKPLNEI